MTITSSRYIKSHAQRDGSRFITEIYTNNRGETVIVNYSSPSSDRKQERDARLVTRVVDLERGGV